MIKLSKIIKKYALFILVCFLPLFVSAYTTSLGTLSPGNIATRTHAWWDVFDCTTNKEGPFTVEVVSTPNYTHKSYNRSIRITVDDYVPETISNITTTCTYYDVDQGNEEDNSGRIFTHSTRTYTYSITAGGTPTTLTNDKTYYIYRDQTIDLADKLGIRTIESMAHTTGSSYGTVSYSGCAAGSSACLITFAQGTANHNRAHVFKIKYVNTAGKTYETTVYVHEQSNTRTDYIGIIDPGEYTYSIYDENTSNFTCSKVTDGPYTVDEDIAANGTSGRIKVTSTNYSISEYQNMKAKCTFTKDNVTHTIYYTFVLSGSSATVKDATYTANGGETFNLWSTLKMKQIVSSNADFGSNATITGCSVGSTSCSVKMKKVVTDGRSTSSTIIYYDQSDALIQSTITINEQILSVENDLGTIGLNSTAYGSIPATGVTCTTNSTGPFTKKLEAKDGGYVLSVTNNNVSVNTYNNLLITCEGTPSGVGGKKYKYNFTFDLSNQTTPIKSTKSYELFLYESLSFHDLFPMKKMYKNIQYTDGKTSGVMNIEGCKANDTVCKVTLNGPRIVHNRNHKMVISYINSLDVLYEVTVNIIEKDINQTTKAYPGLLGFCDFNDDWEYATWADSSGKNYAFYEAKVRGAVLPNCTAKASSGLPLEFKGWTKGYSAGDALNTMSTCGTDLLQPNQPTSYGQTYAPCYEMVPHVKLSTNSGVVVDDGGVFEFNPKDMTYKATGSSYDQEVKLPNVEYRGFQSTNKLQQWQNSSTGETKQPGDKVKLDGSVWVAVTQRTVTQVDLYKSIAKGEVRTLIVDGMNYCSTSSSYVTAVYSSGNCTVTGVDVTPFDVYGDVNVRLTDGTTRVYRFSVEDRTIINIDDNEIFEVDTDSNVIIGENDEATLNNFNTDQCENFFISREGYEKYKFATIISSGEELGTGAYSVYSLCPTDKSTYISLCLDPGRRGPNETGTGTHTRKINGVNVKGNEYVKTSDIQKDTEFGKLVMYLVKELDIQDFELNTDEIKDQRAAAHVAVRSMAIHVGFSYTPDPAHEVYASHYYPYQAIANGIADALADDGDISSSEATNMVNNGYNIPGRGNDGFKNWQGNVASKLIKILTEYGGTDNTSPSDGFERTIDDTELNEVGDGYTIDYKGTITAPTGATASMNTCRDSEKYGIKCKKIKFAEISNVDNRRTYEYHVQIVAEHANKVKPPTTVEQEKDLSFRISYTNGHDIVNAFIASPVNGSDNIQRMLIISTDNPTVYIYFSVVPNTCDLDILKPTKDDGTAKCPDLDTCNASIVAGDFNPLLFKAAGCCRYEMNETTYLYKNYCTAECTNSTMTSTCAYTTAGRAKADFYEINEGAKFNGASYTDAIGTCIVNVQDLYKNDDGNPLNTVENSSNFKKFDDTENLRNVDSYNDNRYCQVTCEEDWEFSMDSFGNFIGEDAVAAGTYFQIVSNDMFMGAKRTCFSTFINYDRFMNNVVDLSNKLVAEYNIYSEWSHVWTDIDEQETDLWQPSYASDALNFHKDSAGVVCVEYFNECPDNTIGGTLYSSDIYNKYDYYYNGTDLATSCKSIKYSTIGDVTKLTCETPDDEDGAYYSDADPTLDNEAKNNDSTQCKFLRTYCDDSGISSSNGNTGDSHETYSDGKCHYNIRVDRRSVDRSKEEFDRDKVECTVQTPASGNGAVAMVAPLCTCPDGYEKDGNSCYKKCSEYDTATKTYSTGSDKTCYRYYCNTSANPGYSTMIGTKCYRSCHYITNPETGSSVSTSVDPDDSTKCIVNVSTSTHTKYVYSTPKYKYTPLKCKTWGKVYDYSLKTENDIEVKNKDNKDIYYSTEEYDPEDLADNTVGGAKDNTQNKPVDGNNVKGNYAKTFFYDCTITPATVALGAVGSSTCSETADYEFSTAENIFCKNGKYATATGATDRFCDAGGGATYNDKNKDADVKAYDSYPYYDYEAAFKFMTEKAKDDAKKKLDAARNSMTSYNSQIYSHAQDLFDCQNFKLDNRTDKDYANYATNGKAEGSIMYMKRSYVSIPTDYNPTASYVYDEGFFMERLGDENVLIRFDEKNNGEFDGKTGQAGHNLGEVTSVGSTCASTYKDSTNCRVEATIKTPAGDINTMLSRNYLETYYYNPAVPWGSGIDFDGINLAALTAAQAAEKAKVDSYSDSTGSATVGKEIKKIVLCSIGAQSTSTVYAQGKDGAIVPFQVNDYSEEWLGGTCFEVEVDYKKAHYVKSSIENSSYYKNKGYWYVRGGDSKIHGDDISKAIKKFNRLQPSGYIDDYEDGTEEYMRWSRLGSFNVFPVSMATPRNLYQYTYTFGNVGSYFDGTLGRIMGNEKSIIQDNTRTCFYEVYEEVCLCCGYKIPPGELVETSGIGSYFDYKGSNWELAGGNTNGNITFYSNSVALGDIGLGRDSDTLGDNWSDSSKFMYNGDDSLITDKGNKLKDNIENTGENIYARDPEYAYFLTPDALKQIRSYNDANGYDLNFDRLIVYDNSLIQCASASCDGNPDTINFQHYGSKFLRSDSGTGINLNSYGLIDDNTNRICVVDENSFIPTYDMSQQIKNGCRWVDYLEKSNNYDDPTVVGPGVPTTFRLAFK